MKSRFLLTPIVLMLVLLCGCSVKTKSEPVDLNPETFPISFIIDTNSVCTLNVPITEKLLYSDNSSYYEFQSGTKIMAASAQVHNTEKFDDTLNVYFTKTGASVDIGNGSITVKCSQELVDVYKVLLSKIALIPVSVQLSDSNRTQALSGSYINKREAMELTKNGNYMPKETLQSISGRYTADLITYDGKWCKSWVQDGLLSDIEEIMKTYMTCADNVTPIRVWYTSPKKDVLYAMNDNCIFAAKALHYNSWCVYYASTNFEDYLRTAMDTVHSK